MNGKKPDWLPKQFGRAQREQAEDLCRAASDRDLLRTLGDLVADSGGVLQQEAYITLLERLYRREA